MFYTLYSTQLVLLIGQQKAERTFDNSFRNHYMYKLVDKIWHTPVSGQELFLQINEGPQACHQCEQICQKLHYWDVQILHTFTLLHVFIKV